MIRTRSTKRLPILRLGLLAGAGGLCLLAPGPSASAQTPAPAPSPAPVVVGQYTCDDGPSGGPDPDPFVFSGGGHNYTLQPTNSDKTFLVTVKDSDGEVVQTYEYSNGSRPPFDIPVGGTAEIQDDNDTNSTKPKGNIVKNH